MLSTDKQTDRQTDKLTNATKNITSFAKEVIIHVYSGITSGRVLNGELLYTKILEVNLFAFATDRFMKISLQSSGLLHWYSFLFPALYCILN